jgi:hypothetical protein
VAEPLYNKPVYDPVTESYFELVRVEVGNSVRGEGIAAVQWRAARRLATQRLHRGVKGRLAVVRSQHVADFLRYTFRPNQPAWIGLRYWCHLGKLQWVTGEFHERGDYSNWRRVWNVAAGDPRSSLRANCRGGKGWYFPVHYWSIQDGFYWNANGIAKEFRSYFVEYVTGGE